MNTIEIADEMIVNRMENIGARLKISNDEKRQVFPSRWTWVLTHEIPNAELAAAWKNKENVFSLRIENVFRRFHEPEHVTCWMLIPFELFSNWTSESSRINDLRLSFNEKNHFDFSVLISRHEHRQHIQDSISMIEIILLGTSRSLQVIELIFT